MEEKEPINVRLSTVILLIIILTLIGGIVYFVLQNNDLKTKQTQNEAEMQNLQSSTQELQKTINEIKNATANTETNTIENTTNNEKDKFEEYKEKYEKTFKTVINGENTISIYLGEERKDELPGITEVYVDASNKAYIEMKNGSKKQVESNVANIYICPEGNGGYSDIVFLKLDGTATKISGTDVEKGNINSTVIQNVKNAISVIAYSVQDPEGGGHATYAFVDIDGNIIK